MKKLRERVFKINKTNIWLRRDQITSHHLITVSEEFKKEFSLETVSVCKVKGGKA